MSGAIEGIEEIRAIAWDFDGVLNRAGVKGPDGRYRWEHRLRDALAAELGGGMGEQLEPQVAALNARVFGTGLRALLTGKDDILDRVEAWARARGQGDAAEEILELMFDAELDLDPALLRLIEQLHAAGITQVLATNNDPRRTRHILDRTELGALLEGVFASGEMGVMKPDADYFARIQGALGLDGAQILLIDDLEVNVDGAERAGWQGWHFQPHGAMALTRALMPLLLRGQGEDG